LIKLVNCVKFAPMIYIGTSGFSYQDWAGVFYPAGMPQREWLSFYAREFNTCEINSTYYALPSATTLQAMAAKTGDGFLFALKANQEMTHQREDSQVVCAAFRQALAPVLSAGKLGCILAQFPYSFDYTRANCDYLAQLAKSLEGLPLVIEFRNARWLRVEVFQWLRQHEVGFCCVDEPSLPNLLPPIAEATSRISYVRFHGRNKEKWWQHEQAYERYDYTYRPEELSEWLPKIKKLAGATDQTFIFANNHWRGQSVDTARQLRTMLD
jgi:uncharacterized protein YecE (DUF72 family)